MQNQVTVDALKKDDSGFEKEAGRNTRRRRGEGQEIIIGVILGT